MTLVADSSAIAAAIGLSDRVGDWARTTWATDELAAPHILPAEVANVLRRAVLLGHMSVESATIAHAELLDTRITLYPYEPLAARVWELRNNLTPYDAWYVALAEQLQAPLVTLDRRLARASGPRCEFRVPPSQDTIQTGME